MKIVGIVGDHLRHLYFINKIFQEFSLSGLIIEKRITGTNSKTPNPPQGILELDKENFYKHFKDRLNSEKKFFGEQGLPNCPQIIVNKEDLNSKKSIEFIKKIKPDLVLTFGCGLIKELMEFLPENTINLHGGLSPRYRGTATMFWPFYFLEPNHVGATFHLLIAEPDAGEIIHQSVPKLEKGDKIHDVACKTIISSTKDMIELIKIFKNKGKLESFKQKGTGKNFLERDFRPEHLRIIYNYFEGKIVDYYLEGKINPPNPKLIRQF